MLNFIEISVIAYLAVICQVSHSQLLASKLVAKIDRPGEEAPQGKIAPLIQCGGNSVISEFRILGCQVDKRNAEVCKIPTEGEKLHAEIDFAPTIDMPLLALRIKSKQPSGKDEGKIIFDEFLAPSEVTKDEYYTITIDAKLSPEAKGERRSVIIEAINMAEGKVRLCLKAEIEFI